MESMYFIIPFSFLFVMLAIGLYIWAVKGGQYDDLDTEGQRILFDEEPPTAAPPVVKPATAMVDEGKTTEGQP